MCQRNVTSIHCPTWNPPPQVFQAIQPIINTKIKDKLSQCYGLKKTLIRATL